ncbi:phage holin family protein [Marinobacter salicampi]|uniref:phage holin family protein n=1 Tax=Marinobacter salicampi TaxID=435907 RepID=UPI00140E6D24|nr:phage holin family protein [Marinobacter salicampi]
MADGAQREQARPTEANGASQEVPKREEGTRVYDLVKHLIDDLAILIRKELALAGSEVSQAVNDTKKGISGLVSGAVVLNSGYLFLLLAAMLGLAQVVEAWLAALIVGGAATILGLIMVQAGKKKLEPSNLKPDRAMNEMQKDKESIKGARS